MKNILSSILLPIVLVVSLHSCKSKTNSKPIDSIVRDTTSKTDIKGNPIDYDHTKVIKNVYVINRKGIGAMQQPDVTSPQLLKYQYGDRLDVIEEKNGWLGIRDRVTRNYKKNGSDWESSGWEKVYIKADATGDISAIKLLPEDLNVIATYKKGEEQLSRLTQFLDISLIDEADFTSKKLTAIDYIVADTTVITKKNGIIELPCGDKIKRYIDKPDAEEQRQEFNYIGNIPFLNKYILSGSYWESADYKLIDKTTGKEEVSLDDYPYISADKRFLISISANGYDQTGDLILYAITSTKLKLIISVSFKNWMPAGDEKSFWANDGCFYLTVSHSKAIEAEGEKEGNKKYQYLKIKIL
ncbi:MAG: SH3 domain-containing protein [Bacteroidota bacterium]